MKNHLFSQKNQQTHHLFLARCLALHPVKIKQLQKEMQTQEKPQVDNHWGKKSKNPKINPHMFNITIAIKQTKKQNINH